MHPSNISAPRFLVVAPPSTSRHTPNRNSTLFLLHGATSPDSGLSSTAFRSSLPTLYQPAGHLTAADQPPESQHRRLSRAPPTHKRLRDESAPGPAQYFLDGARPGPRPVWKLSPPFLHPSVAFGNSTGAIDCIWLFRHHPALRSEQTTSHSCSRLLRGSFQAPAAPCPRSISLLRPSLTTTILL